MSSAAGKLMVLTPDTTSRMGRYITSVDTGISYLGETWKRANLNAHMPRMAGDGYDWSVWSLWYESCWASGNIDITQTQAEFQGNEFDFVITLDKSGSVYLRGYFLADAGVSDGVIATDEIGGANTLLSLVNATDPGVPGAPSNVRATADGNIINVTWDASTSNISTLRRYVIRYALDVTYGGSAPNWTMTDYGEWEVAANVTHAEIPVSNPGLYAVGVMAQNIMGYSTMAIIYNEA